jgi:hypothetical protein
VKRLLMSHGLLTILVGVCAKAQDSTKSTSTPSMLEPALVPPYEVATIKPSKPDEQGRGLNFRGRHLVVTNMTVEDLITLAYNIHPKQLTGGPGCLTVEHYDMDILTDHDGTPSLAWARGVARKLTKNNADNGTNTDPLPSLFTAMQEQIGLRLDVKKAPVKMFVVDGIDRPSAN